MLSINKVFLGGRITFDPELRRIGSGNAVTDVRMAVNRSWVDKDGNKKEKVLFADVTYWGKQAEIICQYFHKGSQIYIEGELENESWEDKNTGEKRHKMKINGREFNFVDKKSDGGDGGNRSQGNDNRGQQSSRGGAPQGRGGYSGAPGQGQRPPVTQAEADRDSDVPF